MSYALNNEETIIEDFKGNVYEVKCSFENITGKRVGLKLRQGIKEEPLQYNKEDLLNPWFIVEPRRN